MRTYTLTELLAIIRRRADMENSQFVSDAEITDYINASTAELDDLLTQNFQDYRLTSRIISLSGTQSFYNLPEDFFKLRGVDCDVNDNFSQPYTLSPFEFAERNQYNLLPVAAGALGALMDMRYRVVGDSIQLIPTPQSSLYLRLWYYQATKKLSNTTRTFTTSDVSTSADTITYASHGYSVGDRISFTTSSALPAPLVISTDYYTVPTTKSAFKLATSRDNAFKNSTVDLTDVGVGTQTIDDDTDLYDGQNGWEEYVIVDCAMKCLEKEESDTTALFARKQQLIARLQRVGKNRDAGMPKQIIDLSRVNGARGGFFG